jgi:ribonuclease T1
MRRRGISGVLILCGVVIGLLADLRPGEGQVSGIRSVGTTESGPSLKRAAPQRAYELLKRLQERQGEPLPGYIGGREFHNRERRLPKGRYREYDVNPKIRGRSRDAERIVIEQTTGKAYYTGDHYRTFIALN